MKRVSLVLAVTALLLLVVGVGTAAAEPPAAQDSGQLAGSDQDAVGAAGTAQYGPSNDNASIRVLSPGESGAVSQSNDASSNASAGNANFTEQNADQTQAGGSGEQVIGQSADNKQDAWAIALTAQKGASNHNEPIRVHSPGNDGAVTQSNDASSDAAAGNLNATQQTADQDSSGGEACCKSDGEQVIGQAADNDQEAGALAATVQEKPSNTNVAIRVLSPGNDGPVSQSNDASSEASAGNLNVTEQTANQAQAGGGGEQVIGQAAESDQTAGALAATVQEKPSNTNVSIRVLSPGNGGPVTQSNEASSDATAVNLNGTKQTADQDQTGGACCKSGGTQVIGQAADNDQKAGALAATVQEKPSNTNVGIRVLSPGNDGPVSQSNTASSSATAANLNATHQSATQEQAGDGCKCGGGGEQVIGQFAGNHQGAAAIAATIQEKPSNDNVGIRVLSPGNGGAVSQSNEASSDATAANLNATHQSATQEQAGDGCKCGGGGEQVIGQFAGNHQGAAAIAATIQEKPSNDNAGIRVLSPGNDGAVSQSNDASSNATAANLNATKQDATQTQGGSGVQVIGQAATNAQGALALGLTLQQGASNENAPIRVLSPGNGGSVSQSNTASSDAEAGNANWTDQTATQTQGGGGTPYDSKKSCCKDAGIQVIGQLAREQAGRRRGRGDVPAGSQAAVPLQGRLVGRQQQRAAESPEPGQRRCCPPVERSDVERGGGKPERDEAERASGSDG